MRPLFLSSKKPKQHQTPRNHVHRCLSDFLSQSILTIQNTQHPIHCCYQLCLCTRFCNTDHSSLCYTTMTSTNDERPTEEIISDLPIISLETPFEGLRPQSLDQLLECMGESWENSATSGFTGFTEDDTVDSRNHQPKRKSRRGKRRAKNASKQPQDS